VAVTVAPGSVDARTLAVEGPVGPPAFGGALAVLSQLALRELLAVVEQTMQPTRASLWLRPPPGSGVA
jgi:hypothetical protein